MSWMYLVIVNILQGVCFVLHDCFSRAIIFTSSACQYSSPAATEGHKRSCPLKELMSAPIHQATSEGKCPRVRPSDDSSSSNREHKDAVAKSLNLATTSLCVARVRL